MEFETIRQDDFSGGVNWVTTPPKMKENELADARNVRLVDKNTLTQRYGYTKYNSSTIGASLEVRAIIQFEGYDGTFLPICQVSDDKIYKGDTAFPGTTTSWTAAITQTASSGVASMDAQWGKLVICNNVDDPLVWEGTYGKPAGCKKTVDNAATYQDWYIEAVDKDTGTHVPLDALDTAANGDWLLIGSWVPKLTGFRLTIDTTNKNTVASVMAVEYWTGSAWSAVSGLTDGTRDTATLTKTLNQTGNVTFTEATTTLQIIDGKPLYWWRVSVDTVLTAMTVDVQTIALIYNMQAMQNIESGLTFKPAGFLTTSDASTTLTDFTKEVTDDSLSTIASVGALTITTGAMYVESAKKFRGIHVQMDTTNINTNAVTLSAKYWDGDSWETLTISDGTSANSKTLAQSGYITWTWPTAFTRRRLSVDDIAPTYIVQLLFSAALSTTVEIAEVECLEYVDKMRPHKLCIYHKNRLFLANRADTPNFLYYSAAFGPEIFNGDDSGYIGLPSGHAITAVCRFFNELFVATADEIYLLEGSTPTTFGLLKVNTGGVGVVAPQSVVAVGKFIYFMHSTGFYRFDGLGVTNLNLAKCPHFFDANDSTNFIPASRWPYVQARFDRIHNSIEWTVSRGSSQTTNNFVCIFDIANESWFFDDVVAASFARVVGSSNEDLIYHGGYTGFVYRDQYGTTDATVAISSYIVTRGYTSAMAKGEKLVLRGLKALFDAESATSMTVTYGMSGTPASSFSSMGSMSLVKSGVGHLWAELYVAASGTCAQFKLANSTSGVHYTLYELDCLFSKAREIYVSP